MGERKKIEIIQILRLFGAICIIIYHSGIVGEHGYFAVDIFSVLSGYILMYSTQSSQTKVGFLRKRLVRIVPLYWAMTLFIYVILLYKPELSLMAEAKPEYLIKSLLFIPFINGKGYDVPILGLGWTLNYEVAFYLIFWLAMRISHRNRGLAAISGIVMLIVFNLLLGGRYFILDYYADSFLLEFAFGIGAYYFIDRMKAHADKPTVKYGLSVAAVISLVWMMLDVGVGSSVERCFRLGIPAVILFVALMVECGEKHFAPILVKLGNATFSIYLIEYFSTALYKLIAPGKGVVVQGILFSVMLFGTLAVGYLTYYLVEQKLGERLKRIIVPRNQRRE